MNLSKDPLNLVITGVGGRGTSLASQLIGKALVRENFYVTIGETYGASQRGGAVMSHLRISKESQFSPLIPEGQADIVVALEPVEALRVIGQYGNPSVCAVINSRPIFPTAVTVGDARVSPLEKIRERHPGPGPEVLVRGRHRSGHGLRVAHLHQYYHGGRPRRHPPDPGRQKGIRRGHPGKLPRKDPRDRTSMAFYQGMEMTEE
ncbi:MAG: 2-oxoacid:acceptor oxidoreductase family protein [Bacillus subtilis]|nr:2-oxoacid:acceptor oxidoreductase family protein [Bacillus subtilis]